MSDKWPKSKYQSFKSTQWFSYKIWTKNSVEPIVYIHNWPLQEQHHFLKLQWEIIFFTFLNTDQNAPKIKFIIEICTLSFQIFGGFLVFLFVIFVNRISKSCGQQKCTLKSWSICFTKSPFSPLTKYKTKKNPRLEFLTKKSSENIFFCSPD